MSYHNIVVSNNASNGNGNGILNSSDMILSASEVNSNRDELGHGGGLQNQGGTLTIQNSTFDYNRTDSSGGGLSNAGGTVSIVNSTFHANETPWEGSAISNSDVGTMTILSTTIAANNSPNDGAALYAFGGGVTIKNSIVADTTVDFDIASSTLGANCAQNGGTITAVGDNLSTDATCTGFTLSVTAAGLQSPSAADCIAVGIPGTVCTPVLSPNPGSAAIDGSNDCTDWNNVPIAWDQQGGPRTPGICDLGADEL